MKIVVFGAGSIGTYIGAALLAAGADVELIGRAGMAERIARYGIHLTDLYGGDVKLDAAQVPYMQDPAALREADLILVTVKSADTAAAADAIHAYAKSSALVISLQNGIGNADVLRARLTGMTVLGGMVPFNVAQMPNGRLHRGTAGELMVEAAPALSPWKAEFEAARLPLIDRTDFIEVQWGKLLMNLNNPVNALSGLPLKDELSQLAYRRCLALLIEEAVTVLRAANIEPATVARVPPRFMPKLLRLPSFVFKRVAGAMLRIDPQARSSMWDDLQAGRRTEIDYLNGAVVALAHLLGRDAPANRRIVELIHTAEQGRKAAFDGETLYRMLRTARNSRAIEPAPASDR